MRTVISTPGSDLIGRRRKREKLIKSRESTSNTLFTVGFRPRQAKEQLRSLQLP